MQQHGRFVRRNVWDYLVIGFFLLLALSLLGRALFSYFGNRDTACRAEITFVIRAVDNETRARLCAERDPFLLPDGSAFTGTWKETVEHTTRVVQEEDGTLTEVRTDAYYDVRFTFTADGARARDGAFLLASRRRIATGESLSLTRNQAHYTAEVENLRIL